MSRFFIFSRTVTLKYHNYNISGCWTVLPSSIFGILDVKGRGGGSGGGEMGEGLAQGREERTVVAGGPLAGVLAREGGLVGAVVQDGAGQVVVADLDRVRPVRLPPEPFHVVEAVVLDHHLRRHAVVHAGVEGLSVLGAARGVLGERLLRVHLHVEERGLLQDGVGEHPEGVLVTDREGQGH